jgi:hypothetical protein
LFTVMADKWANEASGIEEAERVAASDDDMVAVDAVDLVVRQVLKAAQSLADPDGCTERALARQTLLHYFLADPGVSDPDRARLHANVFALSGSDDGDKDDEFARGLDSVAASLAPDRAAARRVCSLARTALLSRARR